MKSGRMKSFTKDSDTIYLLIYKNFLYVKHTSYLRSFHD